MMEAP